MASFTVQTSQTFPDGTVVGAYPRTAWLQVGPPTGAPAGSPVATATVSGGQAVFAGLADNTHYVAYAASPDRYLSFRTPLPSAGSGVGGQGVQMVRGLLRQVAPNYESLRASRSISTVNSIYAANAAAKLTIPTPDASGQVVEPAVEWVPGGWNGHRYWALITGYTNGNDQTENPALYYSDDGVTFTPQPGVAYPLVGPPTGGYNDDPEIVLGPDGKLHLFWVETINTAPATGAVKWCTYDGTTVTAPVTILGPFQRATEAVIAPVVYWDGANDQWVMFSTDVHNAVNGVSAANPYYRRTCPGESPNGTWSAATACTIAGLPANRTLWETHISWRGNQLHMVSSITPFNSSTTIDMRFGISNDGGLTWTMQPYPLLRPSAAGWDNNLIYRGDIVPADYGDGTLYDLWYSAKDAGGSWWMGKTTIKLFQPQVGGGLVGGVPVNSIETLLAKSAIAPYVFGDSVVRADSAASPGSADTGQAYTVSGGGIGGISGNALYAVNVTNTRIGATFAGAADGVYSVEWSAIATGGGVQCWLVFRYQDASNYYRFGINAGAYQYEVIVAGASGGAQTITGAPAAQAGDVMTAVTKGQVVALYVNGVQIATFGAQSSLNAASGMGVQIVGSTAPRARNLSARALVQGA